ncbi:MAG: thioredoxin family protein [bacterium]|nr:thioredoxin family protein [bacterium]MDZ4284205.1 thioredoxin family protein [Patescibacteria group bacterium]
MSNKILLQELSAPGCLHCKEFAAFWESIKGEWSNVEFQDVSVVTPEGQELAQKHMIFASPGIIINGELFSTGGVDKKKFVEKLKKLSA